MGYIDTIQENCKCNTPVSWWPRYAFHYTDVTNAVNILSSGFLYSRANASERGVMKNDNASRQVIDMTDNDVTSMARFYFRPLTPTQYYNEGYKHPDLRYDHDENANVPVPIFLLFDLEKLLSIPGVQFSETSQAGHGSERKSGAEDFSGLDFKKIYDNSFDNFGETKNYRHAEIVHPDALAIESCIKSILCRNNLDRTTLLNLLKEKDKLSFARYKNIVRIATKETFENNGLFISELLYHDNSISIVFSDTYLGKRYVERMMKKFEIQELPPIKMRICLKWFHTKGIVKQQEITTTLDIMARPTVTIKNIPTVSTAKSLGIEVYFDDKLVCYTIYPVENAEIWG